ncbi:MAG: HPr kinase/phosphatase C-terminal domain-containing protein [Cypionkella sp.]|nr:HPr kinase/phosphatase C-terminal domain-containing protein [Cypionkella sp.]
MAALPAAQNIHASCVCTHGGKGLLILGPSGAGKSALALQLIALGARLVADDRCEIWAQGGALMARAPAPLQGLIEARGIGILRLPFAAQTPIAAALDLTQSTLARMPQPRQTLLAGIAVDFLHYDAAPHFPSALMCYLMGQRHE